MRIFVIKDGHEAGPYTDKELRLHWANGAFAAEDLAWCLGQPEWLPLPEFFASPFKENYAANVYPPFEPKPASYYLSYLEEYRGQF
ncbi:MAG: DUF4339 domain-containing protein [Verrucomicrobiota bacterium]